MDIIEAERVLKASANHLILRRIPPAADWTFATVAKNVRRAVFIDTETTGLDQEVDEVIELAMLPFEYDRESGAITRIDLAGAFVGLRQPSIPIPPSSTQIHGIHDTDAAGKIIDAARVSAIADRADLIIAHNAAFDRPMVEKHWPVFERKNWACSFADIDWRAEGLSTGKLDYLLLKLGWFYDGHRATADAEAGVHLLSSTLPVSGRPALSLLLERARRPLKAVRAEETAFEQRAALRQRGYRWDPGDGARRPKAWWILTEDAEAEAEWLNREIYRTPRHIPVTKMPATKRFSAHLWS